VTRVFAIPISEDYFVPMRSAEPLLAAGVNIGFWAKLADAMMPMVGLTAVIAIWQIITMAFAIPDYLLPRPTQVASRIFRDWRQIFDNAQYTTVEILVGFGASVVIGIPLAFCIVLSRTLDRIMTPIMVASQAIPKVAIAPILVVWLGFGLLPKVAISFLIAFFPIVVATVAGLKSVELEMIDLVRSMGASTAKIMLRVRAPTALPHMFSGFKVAICLSVVGAIVGEFVGSDKGLGYMLLTATGTLDGPLIWSALIVLIALGVTLYMIVAKIERLAIRWHVSVRADETTIYRL
jgi:NitT/TauT family transport system permease protein